MRIRVLAVLFLVLSASVTLSLIRGQEGASSLPRIVTGAGAPSEPLPMGATPPQANPASRAGPTATAARDLSRLTRLQQQMLLSSQRGADWLFRMNGVKGRFVPGYLPALRKPMDGDHFLRQAGAAGALARAARFTGEERYGMRAIQAVLSLLDDTMPDPQDSTARYTVMPPIAVDRIAAAAVLVLAICELPDAQKDLHDRAEELCNYIRKQAQPSGALAFTEPSDKDEDGLTGSAQAAYALLMHHKKHPQRWKLETARKALAQARGWWKGHKSMTFASSCTAACTEAYLATKDRTFAEFALEMSDWLCGLQYTQLFAAPSQRIEPGRMLWYGGFMSHQAGRTIETPPTVDSAVFAEGLVEACRVAREMGDVTRYQRYYDAVERCLQFLTTLQYTDSSTQHYADWYRPQIAGAFHCSHEDGNLRIDWTQHAVAALFGYLEQVAR